MGTGSLGSRAQCVRGLAPTALMHWGRSLIPIGIGSVLISASSPRRCGFLPRSARTTRRQAGRSAGRWSGPPPLRRQPRDVKLLLCCRIAPAHAVRRREPDRCSKAPVIWTRSVLSPIDGLRGHPGRQVVMPISIKLRDKPRAGAQPAEGTGRSGRRK